MGSPAHDVAAIHAVLRLIEQSVRTRDYEAVRPIVPDDSVSFGSYADLVVGYEQMRERQFQQVWPRIEDFTIDPDSIHIGIRGDLGWVACTFESYVQGPDGERLRRLGRMTLVLERRAGRWVQVHSHTSLAPGGRLY